MSVLWSNPVEHFHVTQLAIRGADPMKFISYLVSFTQLQRLQLHGVSHEIINELAEHLPACKIEDEE